MKKRQNKITKSKKEILDYDDYETTEIIDPARPLRFSDLGVKIPEITPTQVISIRLPSKLINELRALSSQQDIPYQALIKLFLSESVSRIKKRKAA